MNKEEDVIEKKEVEELVEPKDNNSNVDYLEKIEALEKEKLYLLAKIDNETKRHYKELEREAKYSNKKFLEFFLEFLIDLEERALHAMKNDESKEVKNHVLGIEMIVKNLWQKLEASGVREIPVFINETFFNSRFHEVLSEVEKEDLPENIIIEVIKKGYTFHDLVIKAAQVTLSKKTNKAKKETNKEENNII